MTPRMAPTSSTGSDGPSTRWIMVSRPFFFFLAFHIVESQEHYVWVKMRPDHAHTTTLLHLLWKWPVDSVCRAHCERRHAADGMAQVKSGPSELHLIRQRGSSGSGFERTKGTRSTRPRRGVPQTNQHERGTYPYPSSGCV